jgi:hypothetical protein
MQKVNLRQPIVALVLWLNIASAHASDYGFWFPAVVITLYAALIVLPIVGIVLIYKDVQDDKKEKLTWKFYLGVVVLLLSIATLTASL